jgi:hypothetical protein
VARFDATPWARRTSGCAQSLLALGNVIAALSTGAPHVPYRDSKLTRLLKVRLQ